LVLTISAVSCWRSAHCEADPAQFVIPFRKSHKNDFRDAEAIAEAVLRPTMRFVPTKTVEQLDLQALHRVRSRLVSERTAVVNQIRAFLLERGIAVRQRLRSLRHALPGILAQRTDVLTPRMTHMIEGLVQDWHYLDERIDAVTEEIKTLVAADEACQLLMSVPGVGPIIASAMVASIGNGAAFRRGRDFGLARLGPAPDLHRR
jgi:transposase